MRASLTDSSAQHSRLHFAGVTCRPSVPWLMVSMLLACWDGLPCDQSIGRLTTSCWVQLAPLSLHHGCSSVRNKKIGLCCWLSKQHPVLLPTSVLCFAAAFQPSVCSSETPNCCAFRNVARPVFEKFSEKNDQRGNYAVEGESPGHWNLFAWLNDTLEHSTLVLL